MSTDPTTPKRRSVRIVADLIIPLVLLGVFTACFRLLPWDLEIGSRFYDETEARWILRDHPFIQTLYTFAPVPALVAGIGGLLVFLLGFFFSRLARFRKISLYLALVLIIGPGLIVNSAFKDNWGRPRPQNTKPFGGVHAFEEVWTIDPSSSGKSFPSGHASMGFYFFALYFLARHRRNRAWAWIALAFALLWGAFIGAGRVVQGGHFASDVLWSGGLVFLTAAALYYLLGLHKSPAGGQ